MVRVRNRVRHNRIPTLTSFIAPTEEKRAQSHIVLKKKEQMYFVNVSAVLSEKGGRITDLNTNYSP